MSRYRARADNWVDPASTYCSADHTPEGVHRTKIEKNCESNKCSRNENHLENVVAASDAQLILPARPTQERTSSKAIPVDLGGHSSHFERQTVYIPYTLAHFGSSFFAAVAKA